ncbi:MAG: amidase family protein, partial [Sulfitobacter sp.]
KDALVAERLVDYGQFIEENPEAVLEPVRKAILAGRSYSAQDLYTTLRRLKLLNRLARKELAPFDALVVPTVTRMFKISEMLANPMDNNNIMGTYTYFANPLNLCAVSVPGKTRGDGLPSALCFVAPDGQDGVIRRIGDDFEQQRD